MKANIESLLLSEVKGSNASGWRQDSLFSFCYSLLFRYHPTFLFPMKMCPHDFIYSERKSFVFFPAVPGLVTSPCSKAQAMSMRSTKNFANLTNFSPNWSMAHLKKVQSFFSAIQFPLSVSVLVVNPKIMVI